jgi:hypothetical protein
MFALYQLISILLGVWTWNVLGQGVLFLFAGMRREQNAIYRLIRAINFPVFWLAGKITFGRLEGLPLGLFALFLTLLARAAVYSLFYSQGWIPDITGVGGPPK